MINFAVGPVQMDEEIRAIGAEEVPYFRTPEFSAIMKENERLMKQFTGAPEDARAVFLTGSGTAAMEAAVMNLFTERDRVLVVNGGSFGARFAKICEIHEVPHEEIQLESGRALRAEDLAPYEGKGFTGFLVNVHETSTGVLYDMELISDFCRRNQLILAVDAVSSFLADPFWMGKWGVDLVLTGSQKALALPPGLSILVLGARVYKIDGRRVYIYSDVSTLLSRNKAGSYDLVVKRDGKLVELQDFAMQQKLYDVDGVQQYKYGLYFGYEEKTVGTVLKNTWYTALDFARLVWMSLGDLVSGLVSVNDMSGPVGVVSAIAQTGESAATTADGILNVLYLGAFIAVNLAVMNMLPLRALDGGRAFLLLVNTVFTAITKKKIPSKYEGYIHAAGMILLLAFMAFITFKDIWKLVH